MKPANNNIVGGLACWNQDILSLKFMDTLLYFKCLNDDLGLGDKDYYFVKEKNFILLSTIVNMFFSMLYETILNIFSFTP